MPNQIVFTLGALTVSYDPDAGRSLADLLDEAKRVAAELANAERRAQNAERPDPAPAPAPAPVLARAFCVPGSKGPGRNPAPPPAYVPPATPAEAEQRFYARYGEAIGGRTWQAVRRYLGHPMPRPDSVETWIALAHEVRARVEAAQEEPA